MTSIEVFEKIIAEFKAYSLTMHGKTMQDRKLNRDARDKDIKNVMSVMDAYIFLAYNYISNNIIENKSELYDIFFEYARNYGWVLSKYYDYCHDNNTDMPIEQYINDVFLSMDVDGENMIVNETYVGNGGYIVPYTSYFLLNKILNILKNGNNGVLLADEE
jgi:hypothetical protein